MRVQIPYQILARTSPEDRKQKEKGEKLLSPSHNKTYYVVQKKKRHIMDKLNKYMILA